MYRTSADRCVPAAQAEEADDEKRLTKRKDAEEKQVQQRIQAAVSAADVSAGQLD